MTLISRCRNLVLSSPRTASGETVACTTLVFAERASNVGICWLTQLTLNLVRTP